MDKSSPFQMPLGNGRWLEVEKTSSKWKFKLGGQWRNVREELPQVLGSALCRLPRFGCHTPYHYSVGRHSRLLAGYLADCGESVVAQLLATLHDGSEVLGVGDINANLKRRLCFESGVREYESDAFDFILDTLGISATGSDHMVVHHADKMFGGVEARLMGMATAAPWSEMCDEKGAMYRWVQKHGVYDLPGEADLWLETYKRLRAQLH